MTPQLQLNKHDPENGVTGDCWRASIACIMDFPVELVPDFASGSDLTLDYHRRTANWLAGHGLTQISVPMVGTDLAVVLQAAGNMAPGNHYLVTGKNADGNTHTIIAKDAEQAWDVALVQSPLIGPCDDGYWWIVFLGRRLP